MKQYKTTIIALVLIVVCLGSYFLMKQLGVWDEPAEATNSHEATSYIFPFSTDKTTKEQIVKFECYTNDNIVLEKKLGTWACTSYPDLALKESNITSLIDRMYSYSGTVVFEGTVTPEIQTQYGLSGDEEIIVTMEDGTVFTLLFGGLNTAGTACYAWLMGTDEIYLYSTGFRDYMLINKADLISGTVFDFSDSGQITRISISKKGEKAVQLSAVLSGVVDEPRTWTMNYPIEWAGEDGNVEAFLEKLLAVTIKDIAVSGCEDLASYGLSPAVYSVSLTSPEKTMSLQLGNKTKDGTGYYFTVDGGTDVYIVSESSITFKDAGALTYLDDDVFLLMYTNLSQIQITMGDVMHTMRYEFGQDNSETFYFDGHCVTDTTSDYKDEFVKILTSLYSLTISGIEAVPGEAGETLCEIRYEQRDGTVTTVTCKERDETTMYYYINGEYIGGYGARYLLTSDAENYGIQGTIGVLLECLGI